MMKTLKKLLAGAMAIASVTVAATPAHAVVIFDNVDALILSLAGSEFFGATLIAEPGAFSHQFDFMIATDSLANSSVTTTMLGGNDVDFSSILLDGFAFTQTSNDGMGAENWELSAVSLGGGLHSIFVNGSVVGTSSNGAYSGVLNVGAVPEPGTWAMMLLGFGAIGFAMRRSRRRVPVRLLAQIS